MKKLLLTAFAAVAMTGAANASEFYIDVGSDFGGNSNTANGDNTTGWLEQLLYQYTSNSVVTDVDGSIGGGTLLTDGDIIETTAGFIDGDLSSVQDNLITSLDPAEIFGGPSHNGFGTAAGWGLTFQITGLEGTVSGNGPSQFLNYTSGDITLYYYEPDMAATTDFIELFTISVTGSGSSALTGPFLSGSVTSYGSETVNGVAAGDVFNSALGGFESSGSATFSFIDFNTTGEGNPSFIGLNDDGQGTFSLSGNHDGSISFSVPEPASIAVLGLGLLGMAGAARRRKA